MTDVVKPLTPAEELAMHVSGAMPGAVDNTVIAFDEVTLEAKADQIIPLLIFLRDDPRCQFQTLIDICGVDYPERVQRFDVVYHLLSMRKNKRIRIKIRTDETTPVSSAIPVYPAADWFERETFDMYGVLFNGHPDLRRLLTDYGFQGFPLRKDFPLTGHVEVRYDPEQQRVVYEPVKLPQAYRNFDFLSPWEGMNEILPGDEKAKG
ncbi:MAG: NADH-quinone oxidoreductase subunit C [Alphaproteobacteria bacterium]|nr:MAG: NADH-quinone oxidoreductase subunit C [Caulobacteraceae bacterium]TPW02674.1 MAG: NADH-quinone oxidoreductase subunit C [Alphaproteobacteria bacterium]